jgi:hypothetical protein
MVKGPGTEIFILRVESQYLDSDAVFGMKESLIARFERHSLGIGPGGERAAAIVSINK